MTKLPVILLADTLPHQKWHGESSNLLHMKLFLTWFDYKFIYQVNTWSLTILMNQSMRYLNELLKKVPPCQHSLLSIPILTRQMTHRHATHIRSSHSTSHGTSRKKCGNSIVQGLLLNRCTSLLQMLVSAIFYGHCSPQSKGQAHFILCTCTMALHMEALKRLVSHEAYYRMMESGGSVYAKPVKCKWTTDCVSCS